MNVGVVGGSGFIGSHIVDKLLEAGASVTDFDIMPPHTDRVRHIYVDILDLSKSIVALAGEYDAVYMLAAMANVGDVFRNPTEAVEVNISGTANILEAVRRHDIPRILLASTVWVYSASKSIECDEDTPLIPSRVDHVYTATKIGSEMLVASYAKLYGIKYTILRYGIPYGPRARSGTVIAEFVRRNLNHQPIIIQGDGRQTRRFVYADDLAAANVAALSTKAANRIYNVDGVEEVSVMHIATQVNSLLGGTEIKFTEARPGDYQPKAVSNERIRAELGWTPSTSFDDGLKKYVAWFKASHTEKPA